VALHIVRVKKDESEPNVAISSDQTEEERLKIGGAASNGVIWVRMGESQCPTSQIAGRFRLLKGARTIFDFKKHVKIVIGMPSKSDIIMIVTP
jgi:hypothetical protein